MLRLHLHRLTLHLLWRDCGLVLVIHGRHLHHPVTRNLAVERAGLRTLREGQKVQYELVPGRNGKTSAEDLVVLD
jgi:hypothetical protein